MFDSFQANCHFVVNLWLFADNTGIMNTAKV